MGTTREMARGTVRSGLGVVPQRPEPNRRARRSALPRGSGWWWDILSWLRPLRLPSPPAAVQRPRRSESPPGTQQANDRYEAKLRRPPQLSVDAASPQRRRSCRMRLPPRRRHTRLLQEVEFCKRRTRPIGRNRLNQLADGSSGRRVNLASSTTTRPPTITLTIAVGCIELTTVRSNMLSGSSDRSSRSSATTSARLPGSNDPTGSPSRSAPALVPMRNAVGASSALPSWSLALATSVAVRISSKTLCLLFAHPPSGPRATRIPRSNISGTRAMPSPRKAFAPGQCTTPVRASASRSSSSSSTHTVCTVTSRSVSSPSRASRRTGVAP